MKLFGVHKWKSGPHNITEWVIVGEYRLQDGMRATAKTLQTRLETPKEYHARKKNMITICIFGKCFTFKIPWRN